MAAPARFVAALEAGKPQHIVIYGTSLSKGGAWVSQMEAALNERYPGLVKITNSARGGQSSKWGRANVQAGVIAHQPDAVFIEFAINDAVARFNLSVEQVRDNVEFMITRIKQELPACEIILQIMNPVVGHAEGGRSHRRNQEAYQQVYRDAAARHGLLLIDHSIAWNELLAEQGEEGFKRWVPDGIHPRAAAYARIVTPQILKAIGLPGAE